MAFEVAKRGKGRLISDYVISDIYKEYHKEYKGDLLDTDYKTFRNILVKFNKRAIDCILLDSASIRLPGRLGDMRIKKMQMSNPDNKGALTIDWKSSRKYGKYIYYFNEHTNSHRYRFYWGKRRCRIKCASFYCFEPTRTDKRRLAKLLKEKKTDYFL